ncbi:MAG: ATP synthase F1 subunit gamma [Omnitrophica WOR_2 bacterium GWA2_47_8]|nr:MAG: ATP synthase F1 subunit gamma [Omnitrophica WOR_2 bacterium GWA2_47_8]
MPSLKEYKTKLHSLKNTAKMTRTMKLVAASKLRQTHRLQANAKRYAQQLTAFIGRLANSVESAAHPLLTVRPQVTNILVLVITSDKGLCGGFNNNLNRRVWAWINENKSKYQKVDMVFCGKKGFMFFKSRLTIKKHYENVTAKPNFIEAEKIGVELNKAFVAGEYDEVHIAYNRFNNPLSQTPIIEKILPIDAKSLGESKEILSAHYIFEPEKEELLKFLIPKYFYFRIYYALLENSAGEHGARMTAMDKASQNATDLIGKFTLLRNRARQASITKELIEIVSGAEALK